MQSAPAPGRTGFMLLALSGLLISASGTEANVYGESASLTGSRDNFSATNGLKGSNRWEGPSEDERMTLDWNITQNNGTWDYTYTWRGTDAALDRISHFSLDVTENCADDEECITEANAVFEFGDFFGDIEGAGAVKFDESQAVYSFTSNRAPVWGNFCLKDGDGPDTCANLDEQGNYTGSTTLLWNTGFGQDTDSVTDYIARPNSTENGNGGNGGNDIPTPGTLALLAIGTLGARLSLSLAPKS